MIDQFDWLEDFEMRFNNHKELMNIKKDKLHGKLEINFTDGVPINCNFNKHLRSNNEEV